MAQPELGGETADCFRNGTGPNGDRFGFPVEKVGRMVSQ